MTVPLLSKLQSEFSDFILHGREQGRLVRQLRSPSEQQTVRRLDVYRNAYFIRLESALAHDFPFCERILGRKAFARLAGDYVVAQPSCSPSLRNLGDGFPGWLRANSTTVLADLAGIEWAAMRVFDGPDAEPVETGVMQDFAPEDWATLGVELVPTLTSMSLTSNADEVWLDKRDKIELRSADTKLIVISRSRNFQPSITVLDDDVFAFLQALNTTPSLAIVGEHLATSRGVDAVPELLAKALLTAFAHHWLASVRTLKLE